jgi:HK97 family phage prohead protease
MPPVIIDEKEIRAFTLTEMRVDASPEGKPTIYGYAAVFDQLSEVLWGFQEKIARGAFAKAILEDDVRALFNHDPNYVLGRNLAKTLRMWEDIHGLRFEVEPPDTQVGRDLLESIKRGDIDQMSFAFRAIKEEWEELDKANDAGAWFIRTLMEVKLYDVSIVTYPAYPQTSAAVRDEAKQLMEARSARAVEAGAETDQIQSRARLEILRKRLDLAEVE